MDIIKYILNTPPRQLIFTLKGKLIANKTIKEFDENHPCIYVLSTGRVGTETLKSLLSINKNLLVLHEPTPLLYGLSKSCYQNEVSKPEESLVEAFKALRSEHHNSSLQYAHGYVETSPQSTFVAPIIHKAIANVKFIHLLRHPGSVVRSGMRRGWYKDHPADKTRIIPKKSSHYYSQWNDFTQLQKNIWLWTETNNWIVDFFSTLPDGQKLTLRSEDIFSKDTETLKKLYEFSCSEIPSEQRINNVLSKKLNSQKLGDFPEFKDWKYEDIAELEHIAHNTMKIFNYL